MDLEKSLKKSLSCLLPITLLHLMALFVIVIQRRQQQYNISAEWLFWVYFWIIHAFLQILYCMNFLCLISNYSLFWLEECCIIFYRGFGHCLFGSNFIILSSFQAIVCCCVLSIENHYQCLKKKHSLKEALRGWSQALLMYNVCT